MKEDGSTPTDNKMPYAVQNLWVAHVLDETVYNWWLEAAEWKLNILAG